MMIGEENVEGKMEGQVQIDQTQFPTHKTAGFRGSQA